MNEKIYVFSSATDNNKVLRRYRVSSGTRMVVKTRRIIVDLITCFGNSYVLSAVNG